MLNILLCYFNFLLQIFVNFARNQVKSVVVEEGGDLGASSINEAIRLDNWNGHLTVDV